MLEPSTLLVDLVQAALDLAVGRLRRAESFGAFAFLESGSTRHMARLADVPVEAQLEEARRTVGAAKNETERYVIVHAGEITVAGDRSPAFFADAGERAQGRGIRFAQR